jgi:hypothetical protein
VFSHFYNPTTVAFGEIEFKTWGQGFEPIGASRPVVICISNEVSNDTINSLMYLGGFDRLDAIVEERVHHSFYLNQ